MFVEEVVYLLNSPQLQEGICSFLNNLLINVGRKEGQEREGLKAGNSKIILTYSLYFLCNKMVSDSILHEPKFFEI